MSFFKKKKRGIEQLVEFCLTPTPFATEYKEAVSKIAAELQAEPQCAQEVAQLLDELFRCRSHCITKALDVALALKPSPELAEIVQRILAADAVAPAPPNPRFQPDTIGSGKVGWSGESLSRAHDRAREALRAWGVAPRSDPDEEKRRQVEQTASKVSTESIDEKRLADLIKRFASGERDARGFGVQQYDLTGAAKKMGESALPIIRSLLEQDLNGPIGRAAVIAMSGVRSPKIFPLVELACSSTYSAVSASAIQALGDQTRTGSMDLRRETQDWARERLAAGANPALMRFSNCTDPGWK